MAVFVAVFLVGCIPKITGKAISQIPKETGRTPEVYFCPGDNCGKILEKHISSANISANCAFYDIDLKNVISPLARKSRDIDVKVVIDNSNSDGQIKGDGVRTNNGEQLMHNKFCIIDDKIVITGSFNPTDNDNNLNNNNIVVIYSALLAKNYEEEFSELWNGKFGSGNKVKYPIMYINNIKIQNYFCPEDCQLELSSTISKDSGLYRIIDLIRNAKESIKVASFTFTHETIADELIKADSRGINVTILTESRQRNVMGSQYQRVKDFGLDIRLDGNKYTMHHKFIIIDGKILITGSPNYTLGGFNKNDENFLIIYDEDLALKYVYEFNELFNLGLL
ncbi:hypothetical protein HYX02_01460 [Candidatus Woesearchaeota archaeon]|nr:hypothetical protein [Candidatus Woesearchaeota archaeon]